jgi:hypothetical protein
MHLLYTSCCDSRRESRILECKKSLGLTGKKRVPRLSTNLSEHSRALCALLAATMVSQIVLLSARALRGTLAHAPLSAARVRGAAPARALASAPAKRNELPD